MKAKAMAKLMKWRKTCNCSVCRYSKKIRALARRQTTLRDKKMVAELYNLFIHAEDDRDYWKLKAKGLWPPGEKHDQKR